MYAIVDIETTGGNFKNGRITEIAVYRHDGHRVIDEFVSLVNPECYIPEFITQLTGISNKMVASAPTFPEIARRILDITSDAVFVAHNASFDYNFVRAEFDSLGYDFSRSVLCTVKMSRRLLPGHASYSLGNLTNDLGISIQGRHRAGGDAFATVQLFDILLRHNGGLFLMDDPYQEFVFDRLHPLLSPDTLISLPPCAGLLYFYNQDGNLIHVGQAANIRQQAMLMLAGKKSKLNADIRSNTADLSFQLLGSRLLLGLVELIEKEALKSFVKKGSKSKGWGIFSYHDQKGYLRLYCSALNGRSDVLASFPSAAAARKVLTTWCQKYHLCQHLCGLSDGVAGCFQYQMRICHGACVGQESADDYNRRVNQLISGLLVGLKNAVVIDHCVGQERGFVVVENCAVKGYGFLSDGDCISDIEGFKALIKPVEDAPYLRLYLMDYLAGHPVERIIRF